MFLRKLGSENFILFHVIIYDAQIRLLIVQIDVLDVPLDYHIFSCVFYCFDHLPDLDCVTAQDDCNDDDVVCFEEDFTECLSLALFALLSFLFGEKEK